MIGANKRIIVFKFGIDYMIKFNTEIVDAIFPHRAEKGCLSIDGTRKTKRYESIEEECQNEKPKKCEDRFGG